MNWRKIGLYILFTFGFSWAVALIMVPVHADLSSAMGKVFVAGLYMPAPALATFVIQRFIYKEGFAQYGWIFNKKAAKWLLYTPLLFVGFCLLTFGVIALLGNTHVIPEFGRVDFSQEHFNLKSNEISDAMGGVRKMRMPSVPPFVLFLMILGAGIVAGSTANLPFMFGEEFGWRGLLLWETKRLGFLRANGLIGLIWGVWHWPVILMGHNYPQHHYWGLIMMVLFTTSFAPLFAYIRIKTKTILGPCMLHGMVNATGVMYMFFIANGNDLYSSIAGWAGVTAGVIMTLGILLFDRKFVAEYTTFGERPAEG